MRWYAEERPFLFEKGLSYEECPFENGYLRYSKVGTNIAKRVIAKLLKSRAKIGTYLRKTGSGHFTYHRSPVFWIRSMDFEPYFKSPVKDRSTDHLKDLYCESPKTAKILGAVINSTFFYFWFYAQGNCRNIAGTDVSEMPLFALGADHYDGLADEFDSLMQDLRNNSKRRVYEYKTGRVEYDEFYPSLSKSLIDKIDVMLAELYGLNAEETDFIVNYDIKYRIGGADDNDGEE